MAMPSEEKIKELKQKFPARSLHMVEVEICGDVHHLVMTGPTAVEHKKFTEESLAALALQDQEEKVMALRSALLKAVIQQSRWPEREDIQALFENAPEAIDALHDAVREHAGANAEVRTKKL